MSSLKIAKIFIYAQKPVLEDCSSKASNILNLSAVRKESGKVA